MMAYEDQGTGYDSGARGHELQGRRRHVDLRRVAPLEHKHHTGRGRPAITYRGARRNGARTLGRMPDRQPGQHPWWIGIQPNARMRQPEYRPNISRYRKPLYDRDRHHPNPKGKGFTAYGALANFFFTPAQRRATAIMQAAAALFMGRR